MRTATAKRRPRIAKMQSFPAPIGGWIRNVNLATPDARLPNGQRVNGAAVLENWFPTATGIRMRGGSDLYASVESGDDITALFAYVNGNNRSLFAATDVDIYNISDSAFNFLVDDVGDNLVDENGAFLIDADVPPTLTGFTGGNWSVVQFATTGGVFLDLVNGQDDKLIYDGTTFYPIGNQSLNAINYDGGTLAFVAGQTLTGAVSGATATIVRVIGTTASGTLWLGNVTGGPFQDNEAITSASGAALANGTESLLFDGITGIDPANWSYNWVYKNRLFYIEKDSLNVWYLDVDHITGTATKFPMGGVFTLGGSLLFGASWSTESGDGLTDRWVVFTTEGEVAVYNGNNPSDAANWQKVGVYRIGKPRGPKAFMRAGGDLIIATDIGFIPLSIAVRRDIAALSPVAISYQIEVAWNEMVAERSFAFWHCAVWPTKQMVIVAPPTGTAEQAQLPVANARTGAWALFTGMDVTCLQLFEDRMFFGSKLGLIGEMEVTGADWAKPYTATVVPLFDPLKSPASLKTGQLARATVRAPSRVEVQLSLQADHEIVLPAAPDDISVVADNTWGTGVWGTSLWGTAATKKTFREWQSVGGSGYALAVAAQITSGSLTAPDVEFVETELTFDMGDVVS